MLADSLLLLLLVRNVVWSSMLRYEFSATIAPNHPPAESQPIARVRGKS